MLRHSVELIYMILAFSGGLGLYLLYLASFHLWLQVSHGHIAVLTAFGKAISSRESPRILRTLGPGLHFKWPWQKAVTVSVMEQMLELSGEEGGTTAMASDGTMLRLDSKLRFTPVEAGLYDYLFAMARPLEHMKGLFTCLLRNEIANFDHVGAGPARLVGAVSRLSDISPGEQTGSYALIRRERRRLNERIREFSCAEIGNRYGVRFEGVDLTDILPPDELAQALNSVINAQSGAAMVYAQTEAECEQRSMAAERGLDIAKAKANAVEIEISTMATILLTLQRHGTLGHYISRRRAEVLGDAKVAYIRSTT
jgi:regulator of protease activity HflC (stomatin/prohibitin superfamily)